MSLCIWASPPEVPPLADLEGPGYAVLSRPSLRSGHFTGYRRFVHLLSLTLPRFARHAFLNAAGAPPLPDATCKNHIIAGEAASERRMSVVFVFFRVKGRWE
jgi:hypothetical protein